MAANVVSKLTLPNNTTYLLKDNSQSRSVHKHITSDIGPLLNKTYENYTVTANDGNNGVIYFGTIMPDNLDNYFAPWWIHYTLEVTTSEIQTQGYYDVYIGAAGTTITYHIFNNMYSTSYCPIYYHRLLFPKQGYQEQGAHIGVRIQSARSPATLARTYKINLLEQYGCTFSFKDSLVTYGTLYNATYYNSGEYSASQGLQETADSDTTGRDYSHAGYLINSSTFRMAYLTLFGFDRENKAQGISLYSSEYTGSTNNINTTRVYNTAGFDWTRGIWYTNSYANFAKSADLNISPSEFYYNLDFRYTDNCVAATTANSLGLVMRNPVYLRGYIKEDGLFYLDPISVTYNNATYQRAWTQDIPTTKTYHGTYRHVFWNIGMPYYNTSYPNSGYQINLHTENKLYWYSDNNHFEEYILEAQKVNGHTIETNVPSNAKFTDTITTLAISGSPSITNTPQSGAVTLGAAAAKSITDNSSNADVTSTDTNLITGRTLYYQLAKKGYTTNTGTVTTIATGSGLTGGPITTTGTISIATGGVTNDMLAGSIANGKLANSSISIAGTSVSLGGTLAAETLRTNLGLSTAMHFRGIATVAITDGSTTNPTIDDYDFSKKEAGDVIIDSASSYEYVWSGSAWERLGPDGSYKTIQTAVSDPAAGTTGQINFINSISQNTNGVITATKQPVRVATTSQTGVIQITKDNINRFLNQLDTGSSTPVDNDYYISQYVGGGTTTTTYHRRPMSALWAYIKGKTDLLYNNYSHPTGDGNLHVPATSTTNNGKFLKAGSTAGSLSWATAVTSVGTGVGLTGGSITTTGTIKAKLRNETALGSDSSAAAEVSNRVYPVAVDKSGYLAVNVPWTNVNANYLTGITSTTSSTSGNVVTGITASGSTITYTLGSMAISGHTHDITLATDTGTSSITLAHGGKYKLTAGGKSIVFTMPTDNNTWTAMGGATSSANGSAGYIGTAPTSSVYNTAYWRADATWAVPPDTKVTSSSNHYTPATASGQDKTASASGASAAWSIDVVKGVTLNTDGKGHVTGISVTSGKIPANPNTDSQQNIILATTSKAYITGVTTMPTATAQALTGVADTGVYLTTTAGEISALRHSWHDSAATPVEKVYTYWNTTDQSLDFVFI